MASIATLSARLDALLVGIRDALAGKLGATATAVNSALLGGKTADQIRADVLSNELGDVVGRPGEFAIFSEESVPGALRASPLLKTVRFAADDTAINNLKAATISFSTVFDKWLRISHNGTYVSPASESELSGWSYDSGNDTVASTINSGTYIGLISNDRFDAYTFETIMKSNVADDDVIGMVMAYKKIGDVEHTLSVLIDGGGMTPGGTGGTSPKLTVIKNFPRADAEVLYQQSLGVGTVQQTWSAGADLVNGVKVMVKRKVDGTFEVTSTRADGSPWPNPISWSGPIPALFQKACQIGYSSYSQAGSTWENLQVPTSKDDIIDTRDTTVWKWVNDAWVNNGQYAYDPNAIQRGLFYKDTVGFGSYYMDLDGDLYKMGGPGTLS